MASLEETTPAYDYDAVIVLGGGLTASGKPHGFVEARLREGARFAGRSRYAILLSRGTTHKAPPLNPQNSFPIDESAASAAYFATLVPGDYDIHSRVLLDSWSFDTIGNCYFTLRMHCEPLALRRLVVVTSSFHMPRTEAIFHHIFDTLSPDLGAQLTFVAAPDDDLPPDVLALRREKEAKGLSQWRRTMAQCNTRERLARFLFVQHSAYNCKGSVARATESNAGDSNTSESNEERESLAKVVASY